MERRVVGIETEYGITAASTSAVPTTIDADTAARRLFDPLVKQGRATNLFLRNGGRLYLDVGSHPEYATAECDRLEDLLAQDRSGTVMLAELARKANEALEAEGMAERIHLLRNNLDTQGNSFGCHENYLLHRRRDFRDTADSLISFFVTRQIFVGSGHIRLGDHEEPAYVFSQRSDQMWDSVSSATTRSRPIINTRDEALADSGAFRRMHVIVGDTNMCEATTALKIGMTELLLSVLEEGLSIADLALADPMKAIRDINEDLTGGALVDLKDGRHVSALDIQEEILSRVASRSDESTLDDLHTYVLNLWRRCCETFRSGDWSDVEKELDVAIKRHLVESYVDRSGAPLDDPKVTRLLLSYHDITDEGLRERLEKSGLMKRLTNPQAVEAAVTEPPATTRASLRGRIIGAAEDARVDIGADWVHVRLDKTDAVPLSLQDPFATEDERVDRLIAQINEQKPFLPA